MTVVLTMDQKASRSGSDQVGAWADRLNERFGDALSLPFVRTAGDEMQAVLGDGDALPDLVLQPLREGAWWVGVGLGAADFVGATARDSDGPAFWHAREAVERAKKTSRSQPVAVVGEPADVAEALSGALGALAFIVLRRSAEQQEAAELAQHGLRNNEIAERLGVTPSAVSQRLRTAGAAEEAGLRRLVSSLVGQSLPDA